MLRRIARLFQVAAEMSLVSLMRLFRGSASAPSPPPAKEKAHKILVLAYGGLGDILFLLPAIQALRKHFAHARIVCMTGAYSAGGALLNDLTQAADEIRTINWTQMKFLQQQKINRALRKEGFDILIAGYTNPIRFFLTGLAFIPIRVGHCRRIHPTTSSMRIQQSVAGSIARRWWGQMPWRWCSALSFLKNKIYLAVWEEELFRKFLFNKKVWIFQDKEHEIDKALRLAYALGISPGNASRHPLIKIPALAEEFAEQFLSEHGIEPKDFLVGMQLGISRDMPWKQWGLERFAQLACKLISAKQAKLLLLGSEEEKSLACQFIEKMCCNFPNGEKDLFTADGEQKNAIDAVGKTALVQTAALIRKCRLLIANDSGPAKLAMALGVPTAIVWGPSDRYGAGPWESGKYLTIANEISCSPCFALGLMKKGRGVLNYANCGHHNCLNALRVEEALDLILKMARQ